MTDLVGRQTQLMMMPVHSALPFVKQGKVRMLGVLRDTRSPFAPRRPQLRRTGRRQPRPRGGVLARRPGGTGCRAVTRLNREVNTVLALPQVREALAVQGITPESGTPAQLASYIRGDIDRWKKFVAEQDIRLE